VNRPQLISVLFAGLIGFSLRGKAAETNQWEIQRDIVYAKIGEAPLALDLYLPRGKAREPLIIWVHGERGDLDRRKACR
jgi:hypothetical protein